MQQECKRWLAPGPGGIHRLQAFCNAAWSGLRAMQDAVGTSGLVVDPMVAVHICGFEDNRGLLETVADLDFRLRGLEDYVRAGSLREEEAHAGGALRALVHSAVKANIFGGPADAVVCVQRASGTSMHAPALLGLRILARAGGGFFLIHGVSGVGVRFRDPPGQKAMLCTSINESQLEVDIEAMRTISGAFYERMPVRVAGPPERGCKPHTRGILNGGEKLSWVESEGV